MSIFGKYATLYQEKGYAVTPTNGKIPFITAWETNPLVNASKHTNSNIGLITGKLSGLVAIDVDVDDKGVHSLFAEKTNFIRLGRPARAMYIFRYEEKFSKSENSVHKIKNANGNPAPAIEFLSNGRQFILPPSIHPDTNAPYVWADADLLNYELDDVPYLDIDIYAYLENYKNNIFEMGDFQQIEGDKVPEGGRNNYITGVCFSIAQKIFDKEITFNYGLDDLINHDKSHCVPPLFDDPKEEAPKRKLQRSLMKLIMKNEEVSPPINIIDDSPPSMTIDYLPEVLKKFVSEGVRILHVPLESIAIPLIASFSTLFKNLEVYRIKNHIYCTPTLTWSMGLNTKGTRKSASLSYATQFLYDIQKEIDKRRKEKIEKNKFEIIYAELELKIKQAELKKIKEKVKAIEKLKEIDELEKEIKRLNPDYTYFMYNDTTTAGLIEYFENAPYGLVNVQDELSSVLSNFQGEHSSGMRQLLLTAHNGKGRYEKKLKGQNAPTVLENFSVSFIGMTQPAIFKNLFAKEKFLKEDDGFLDRFQMVYYPNELIPRRLDKNPYDSYSAIKVRDLFMKLFFGKDGEFDLSGPLYLSEEGNYL
jgi:hypothetical protein